MSKRSSNILKHIGITALTRPISMLLLFIQIRFMVAYLGDEKYGIWATLLSIMSWISSCDMGVGNGLRNKLGEAFAVGNKEKAKEYIATSYFIIFVVSLILFICGFFASIFLDWQKVFNSTILDRESYIILIGLNLFFVCINFITAICNQIFYAHQEASKVGFNQLTSQILFLPILVFLMKTTDSNLFLLSLFYGATVFISNIFWTMTFFYKQKDFRCCLRHIKKERVNDVMGLGVCFFVMQLSSIVIFTTDNLLITQLFGPADVTPYDIVYKLFSIFTVVRGVILVPIWVGFTDAYVQKDFVWIKKTLGKLLILEVVLIFCVFIFILLVPGIVKIWIGHELRISKLLIISLGINIIISSWNDIFATFLNGIGAIKLSMSVCIVQGILNIPLSIYLTNFFGISGIVLGTVFTLLISSFTSSLQTFFILMRKEIKRT